MNDVTLSGRLSSDAKFHEHDGVTYAQVELLTLSTFQHPAGERHQRLDVHRVTLFDALAQRVRSLKEGDSLTIRGALRTCELDTGSGPFLAVEIIATEVERRLACPGRSTQPTPAGNRDPRRIPRPRLARSSRRSHPGRGIGPLHPVDDEFLFDELATRVLGADPGDEP